MATTPKKTDIIKIFSNESSVSHQPRNGEIYWLWEKNPYENECYIEKTREEIERELRQSKGLRKLFEMGSLVLKDKDLVEKFGLNCLDEYVKSIDELKEFVDTCSIAEFEDYCEYAPQSMIDNIAVIYTKTEMIDTRKIRIYKEFTGKDLTEFYEDNANTGTVAEAEPQQTRKPARKKKLVKE